MSDPTLTTSQPSDTGPELPPHLLSKLKITIPGYELLSEISSGGQAIVYRARELTSGLTVAIKLLHAGPFADASSRERFRRETRALKSLNHPNIVTVIDSGTTPAGLDFLVMNFVDGNPLDILWNNRKFAAQHFPEPPAKLRLFKRICDIVQAAHRNGITHRDLSPSNILLDDRAEPHILDFGLASTAFDNQFAPAGQDITLTHQFLGKVKYASPEQARGDRDAIDPRTDVYALGVILYQILTNGAFPYEVVGNMIDVLNNILHTKPLPPSDAIAARNASTLSVTPDKVRPLHRGPPLINEAIERIVLRALEKDPALRYESAGALASDVNTYLDGKPILDPITPLPPHTISDPPITKESRRKLIFAAAIVVAAIFLTGVSMTSKSVASFLGLTTLLVSLGMAQPAEPDPSLKLADARAKYETEVEELRVQVDDYLESLENQARDLPQGDRTKVAKTTEFKAQRAAFKLNGTLVDAADTTLRKLNRAYRDARNELSDSYTLAIDTYRTSKFKRDDLADSLQHDLEALLSENDFNGWGNNLVAKVPPTDRALTPATPKWVTDIEFPESYRLQITGKADAPGTLTLELPIANGKLLTLPVKITAPGKFTLLLSIRPDLISADLGIERPIATDKVKSSEDKTLTLQAEATTITIDSITTKQINAKPAVVVKQVPEMPAQQNGAQPGERLGGAVGNASAQNNKLAEAFPVGSLWKGIFTNSAGNHSMDAQVTGVTGTLVSLQTDNKYGTRYFTLDVQDSEVSIMDNDPESVRRDGGPITKLMNIKVKGTIQKSGDLRLEGTWTFVNTVSQNERVKFSLRRVSVPKGSGR